MGEDPVLGSPSPRSLSPDAPAVRRHALLTPMRLGNWRFAVYILIIGGFWTAFNQLFITMNLYIRDFVNTTPLIDFAAALLRTLGATGTARSLADYAAAGGQVNPEYLVNIDALCIVALQLVMLLIVQRLGRFPGMIVGVVLVAVGIGLPA
jgi:proton-dependent oligopeptide transporter, POT family